MSLSSADYTVVLNDDLSLDPTAIEILISYLEQHPQAALATPIVLMHSRPDVMNTAGNRLSYCGLPSCRGKGQSRRLFQHSGPVAAVAGCAFAIRKTTLEEIGGFSQDFDQYPTGWHSSLEDADLSLRAWMAGYEVHYVAESIAYHRYSQRGMNAQRFSAIEFGRILLLLRNLERKTLFRLIPLMAATEAGALLYAALRGPSWLLARLSIPCWVFLHRRDISTMRCNIQRLRKVHDSQIFWHLDDQIEFAGALGGTRAMRGFERMVAAALRTYRLVVLGRHYARLDDRDNLPRRGPERRIRFRDL